MSESSVTARVRCVIDIPVGKWGRGAVLGELAEQVRREGENIVRKMVSEKGGYLREPPKVIFVMTEEE